MTGTETFLGIPLLLTGNRTKDFIYLKSKVYARLERWCSKLLSQTTRVDEYMKIPLFPNNQSDLLILKDIKNVNATIKEYHQVQTTLINDIAHHATQIPVLPGCLPQSLGQVKVYIDATFKDGKGAAYIVTRGKNDQILPLATSLFSAHSLLEAELRVLEVGLL
ncbi:hypothetical protein PanWU01x14_288790 [Parasponia andersonii]|uniref:Uncharacterized protein n=1 Tax=Parasponia andersonii TaxID=3476 RepID=A0A2P5AYB6_PARAD|nr:hypothetical protein PanWU01x14_288790 [Parasponia andersonii]